MNAPTQVQTRLLQRARAPDAYALYRAALEWGLEDPIVIEGREDLKSEYRWRGRIEPFHHQVTNLITFCRRLPVTLLADDVGLGKTISAGLVASELIARRRIQKILIVCPKLLGPQWREELQTKFNIPAEVATGRDLIDADPEGDIGAIITTYHSARLYLEKIPTDRFQMLVLDEAHKLRNLYGVPQPPQVAKRFRQVLEARVFKYVLMLTATPIQNRLWDLYSLVDLLTVARGHENPFGSESMFARTFIADNRTQARHLKQNAREKFRSIVYGYMSRVRRADANLVFPERIVLAHKVAPTNEELQLIAMIAKPIQRLNRLAQISVLQALTSSPDALAAQLENMARNGTIPGELAAEVRALVSRMRGNAKLQGLAALVEQLRAEQPERWRMVVFTQRRETQTTIQNFLETCGIRVGIINGDSGERNQETIARFWKSTPDTHVIVSTEAGSEGVNLQVANVLVNYDLPWNPMIVEQRIGRVQRLASEHANVCIYSVILRGTFEEYIVSRLLEKLQMASHAIGDVESLLEASGLQRDDDGDGFEEQIRKLVVESLAGKNVEAAARAVEESIKRAKLTLEEEERNINALLGSMDGVGYKGPRTPVLPATERSIPADAFVLAGLRALGAVVELQPNGLYRSTRKGRHEVICLDPERPVGPGVVRYAPGTSAFDRLVAEVSQSGAHAVEDCDAEPRERATRLAESWVASFGGETRSIRVDNVIRSFEGTALMRVRATVAHDSYERLIEVPCAAEQHRRSVGVSGLAPLGESIDEPASVGVDARIIAERAAGDPPIAAFCRFYAERRSEEVRAAGGDARKRRKLEGEFIPRLEVTLVGLQGKVRRHVTLRTTYTLGDDSRPYTSTLSVTPSTDSLDGIPDMERCSHTNRMVPEDALGTCAVSGKRALKHVLVQSAASDRIALPEHMLACAVTGRRIITDEAERSDVTGKYVTRSLLRTSKVSGKRAEPEFFAKCAFTGVTALESELAVSEASGKRYRTDQQLRSAFSGKTGHRSEFVECAGTRQPLFRLEAEQCEATRQFAMPGVLERCTVTGAKVLPSELARCSVTGKKALKGHFVTSSVSGVKVRI